MNESPEVLSRRDTDKNRQTATNVKFWAERLESCIKHALKCGDGDAMHLRQALMHLEIADMLATKGLLGDGKH